jgi:alpha-mannosidase
MLRSPFRHGLCFPPALLLLAACLAGASPGRASDNRYLKGYVQDVSGETIGYHSHHPYASMALLTRATDGNMKIEWKTEPIPADVRAETAEFLWIAGHSAGTSTADTRFDLYLNGEQWFQFTTRSREPLWHWTVTGKEGATLSFDAAWADQVDDLFGYMVLKVPVSYFKKGESIILKVVGEKANRRDWFMTFKYAPAESIAVRPQPALILAQRDTTQLVDVLIDHMGTTGTAAITAAKRTVTFPLKRGFNRLEVPVEPVESPKDLKVSVAIDGGPPHAETLTLRPVRSRTFYFLPHSHNDIGYSDVQTDVELKQLKNIRDALQLFTKTAAYPPEARFRWNIEILWPVETFLKTATDQEKKEFVEAVRSGSLGLNACYSNQITGICRPEELLRLTDFARHLSNVVGLPINTALISDIPGSVWSTVPALALGGVKYFSSGPNYFPSLTDGGDRVGHFNKSWGDRPFYWVSPSGEQKILFWVAGKGYSWFHGGLIGKAGTTTAQHLFDYVNELDRSDYPYEMVQLRYTIVADNGPTDAGLSDFVKTWNERYVTPRLVISTAAGMFQEFEQRYGADLPAYSGDITPYWEDGALSTLKELALVRRTSERLLQTEALSAIINPALFRQERFYEAWKNVHLFDEHTWGAFNSVSDPDTPFAVAQWRIKQDFATNADSLSRALATEIIGSSSRSAGTNTLWVVNTNSWSRTDLVLLQKGQSRTGDVVLDNAGKPVPSQRLSTGELAFIAREVPPHAGARYTVRKGKNLSRGTASAKGRMLGNGLLSVELDSASGALRSLRVKEMNVELVDRSQGLGLNEYLYVPGKDPAQARKVDSVKIRVKEAGPVVASLVVESSAPGSHRLSREIRIIDGIARVDLSNTIDKAKIREKESVHIAFPFNVPDAVVRLDNGWGIVRPEADQLPGSCKDFLYAQRWADVSNQSSGLLWTTNESPIVEIGEMTSETPTNGRREWRTAVKQSATLFSYVMNNYWHTNYKADQEGEVSLRYSLFPHRQFNAADAYRLGTERSQPLLVIVPGEGQRLPESLFTVESPGVVVSSLKPSSDGKAVMVRLFNAGAKPEQVVLKWGSLRPARVRISDLNELPGDEMPASYALPAFGIVTLRCEH